jgi:hypothetical protein
VTTPWRGHGGYSKLKVKTRRFAFFPETWNFLYSALGGLCNKHLVSVFGFEFFFFLLPGAAARIVIVSTNEDVRDLFLKKDRRVVVELTTEQWSMALNAGADGMQIFHRPEKLQINNKGGFS